uniref:Fatty acyl-CoA reductase n=1 Tax=Streltzoviella insularis TaxID=1206366 RepID=A0A7D5UMI2_9NEOP|nr:fatty acyl-CoA reductase 6 [Streltzoviella insularis]
MFCKIRQFVILRDPNGVLMNRKEKLQTALSYSSTSAPKREGQTSVDVKTVKNENKYQSVAEFYAGKSVFITGGTGFLGKAFIEKLLYSCKDIEKIYILAREKKGSSIEERVNQLSHHIIFTRLKKEKPEALKKIIPISGDITLPNLGIKPEDEKTLTDKVSVVIHSAATVRFDEPLKVALNINVEGTRKVLELSKRMKKIESFVHVSTAFSNIDRPIIDEKVYPSPRPLAEAYQLAEKFGFDKRPDMKSLCNRPNTYTFTKAIAEAVVAENRAHVPAVIVRPSCVTAMIDEPMVGWVDNWFGMTALLVAISEGSYNSLLCEPRFTFDIIPVDYITNLTIVAAAKGRKPNEVAVYNCTSSDTNPITFGEIIDLFVAESVRLGHPRYPVPKYTTNKYYNELNFFIRNALPSKIGDLILRVRGKPPKHEKLLARLYDIRDNTEYFTTNTWTMRTREARKLASTLSPEDREQFKYTVSEIHWPDYIPLCAQGAKRHLKWRS